MQSASPGAAKSPEGSTRPVYRRAPRLPCGGEWSRRRGHGAGGRGLDHVAPSPRRAFVLLTQPRLVDLPPHGELACVPPQGPIILPSGPRAALF